MGSAKHRMWHAEIKMDADAHGQIPVKLEKDAV
jgi:hypothetical protein